MRWPPWAAAPWPPATPRRLIPSCGTHWAYSRGSVLLRPRTCSPNLTLSPTRRPHYKPAAPHPAWVWITIASWTHVFGMSEGLARPHRSEWASSTPPWPGSPRINSCLSHHRARLVPVAYCPPLTTGGDTKTLVGSELTILPAVDAVRCQSH